MTGTTDPVVNLHPEPRPQAPAGLRQRLARNLLRPVRGVTDGD